MSSIAEKYRRKHPDRNLKVMFWPKSALSAFQGMNDYDPQFGEAFVKCLFNCDLIKPPFRGTDETE